MQAGQTCYSTDLTVWSGISPGLYRMLFDSTMSSTTLLLEIWKNWMESTDDTQLRSNQSEGCICLLDWKGRPSTIGPQYHPKISITADNGTWWRKILACLRTWAGSIPTMIALWNFSLCNHTHARDITYPNKNDHTATLQGIYNCTWKSYMQNCTFTHEVFMYIKGQCSLQPLPTTARCNYKISVHITTAAHDGANTFTLLVCDQLMQGKWNSLLRSCLMTSVQSASNHKVCH